MLLRKFQVKNSLLSRRFSNVRSNRNLIYAGSRVIDISNQNDELSTDVALHSMNSGTIEEVMAKLKIYNDNHTIAAVFLSINNTHWSSSSSAKSDSRESHISTKIAEFASVINQSNKTTVAVLEGKIDSQEYAALASSQVTKPLPYSLIYILTIIVQSTNLFIRTFHLTIIVLCYGAM